MNIVWLSHSQKLGGAERSQLEGVRGLIALGHRVTVILPLDGELTAPMRVTGAQIVFIPSAWWVHVEEEPFTRRQNLHRVLSHARASWRIGKFLRRARPDVVITNTLTIVTGALAARALRLPHVWYIHEFGHKDHGFSFDWGTKLSLGLINRLSRRIMVNSQAVREYFAPTLPPAKLRLAHYALEMPLDVMPVQMGAAYLEHLEPGTPPLRLILMGQIAPGKRQEDAIRAVALLKERGIPVHLTIIGSEHHPAYSALVRQLVTELDVASQVDFLAFTSDPLGYLAGSDIVLLCSSNEAFGRVTVEAMKLGKPVVGTRSAGTLELIADGERGLLYPVGDSKALAECIAQLWQQPELYTRLGQDAQEWALRTFNLQNYAATLQSILLEVVPPRTHRDKGATRGVEDGSRRSEAFEGGEPSMGGDL